MHKLMSPHGDADHIGESIDLVNNFKIDKVYLNDFQLTSLETRLIKILKNKNISYNFLRKGTKINLDKYIFSVINPDQDLNENDNSIVLYTNLEDYEFMFTGDISEKVEKQIVKEYIYKLDVLKVAHHGSLTSTSEIFLDAFDPKYAIIEVGLNNRFNHPHQETLNKLKERKIKTYQTAIQGTITIEIVNQQMKVTPYLDL